MGLFSDRSQKTSKCGKNINDTLSCVVCHCFVLPQFYIICDLLLTRCVATWNPFVKLSAQYKCCFCN